MTSGLVRARTHHSLGLDLSTLEVFDRSRETVGLREGPNDLPQYQQTTNGQEEFNVPYLDFVAENLGRWPRDTSLFFVDTIDKERSSPSDVVDRILDDGLDSSRFNDDVESERVVLLEFIPLRLWIFPEYR